MTEPTHETEEPEATDNSPRDEDGEQDITQDSQVAYDAADDEEPVL